MSYSEDGEEATMSEQWRSSASGNLSTKRVRPWDVCDDVQELKMMLIEKEEQLTKKDGQLADLQRKLKSAKKQAASSAPGAADPFTSLSSKKTLTEQVSQLRRSIQAQVFNQMVYKPSSRHGNARLVPVDIFGITEPVIEALVGEELFAKASSGPKQFKLVLSNEELETVFERGSFIKSLRYGATLELSDGLKFVTSKSEGNLKISGTYTMRK